MEEVSEGGRNVTLRRTRGRVTAVLQAAQLAVHCARPAPGRETLSYEARKGGRGHFRL